MARQEIALTLLTLMLIGTLLCFSIRIFVRDKFKSFGTATLVTLHPLNLFQEYIQFLMDVKLKRDSRYRDEDFATEESETSAGLYSKFCTIPSEKTV